MAVAAFCMMLICGSLLLTAPIWLARKVRGRCLGLPWSEMSIWRAIGDLSFVITALVVLANLADLYAPLAACLIIAMGHCSFPGSAELFVTVFFFQMGTIPVGLPFAAFACVEAMRRVRGTWGRAVV